MGTVRSLMLLSFGSWKEEQSMKTLEELQAELTRELLELQRLTGTWPGCIGYLAHPFKKRRTWPA